MKHTIMKEAGKGDSEEIGGGTIQQGGKEKLGKLEKEILYELDSNSFQTLAEIGKKIKKSPQYVEYWIKKFTEERMIKYYIALIDYAKLGYTYYYVYYSLRGMSPEVEGKFVEYVTDQDNVGTVFKFHGAWDMVIGIFARDALELNETVSKINEKYGEYIWDYTIETNVGERRLGRRHLFREGESDSYVLISGGRDEGIKIDEDDMKILSAIKENARAPTIELGKTTGLSPDVVRYRLKKLKDKIIVGASYMPDKNYPYRFYRVLIKLKGLTPAKEKEIISFFSSYPDIWRIHKTLGNYTFAIDMDVETTAISRKILTEFKNRFYDVLVDFDILHVWDMVKHCYFINFKDERNGGKR